MKRFLLVDDEENFLELLAEAINDEFECTIDSSSRPIEALELLQEQKYDLILVDFMMPKMNGGDLVKAVRSKAGQNQTTPIIILTANIDAVPADVKGQKDVGFFDKLYYLTNLAPYIKMTLAGK